MALLAGSIEEEAMGASPPVSLAPQQLFGRSVGVTDAIDQFNNTTRRLYLEQQSDQTTMDNVDDTQVTSTGEDSSAVSPSPKLNEDNTARMTTAGSTERDGRGTTTARIGRDDDDGSTPLTPSMTTLPDGVPKSILIVRGSDSSPDLGAGGVGVAAQEGGGTTLRFWASVLMVTTVSVAAHLSQEMVRRQHSSGAVVMAALLGVYFYEWCSVHGEGLTTRLRTWFDEGNILETYQPRARLEGHLFQADPPTPAPTDEEEKAAAKDGRSLGVHWLNELSDDGRKTEEQADSRRESFEAMRKRHYDSMYGMSIKALYEQQRSDSQSLTSEEQLLLDEKQADEQQKQDEKPAEETAEKARLPTEQIQVLTEAQPSSGNVENQTVAPGTDSNVGTDEMTAQPTTSSQENPESQSIVHTESVSSTDDSDTTRSPLVSDASTNVTNEFAVKDDTQTESSTDATASTYSTSVSSLVSDASSMADVAQAKPSEPSGASVDDIRDETSLSENPPSAREEEM